MANDKTMRAFQITVRRSVFAFLDFLLIEKQDTTQVTRFNIQENTTEVCVYKYDFDAMMESMITWRNGDLVQTAFPYMSSAEREWLLTGNMFNEFFNNTDSDEDI